MASTDIATHHESERANEHGENKKEKHGDHARSRRQASGANDGGQWEEHVPVCKFVKDNFPLLTANKYFRTVYDFVANLYFELKNSFIVQYIVGWIMVFIPLLNPAFMVARMWYWAVWLVVKPVVAFWKKVGSVLGINAVLIALWKKNLQLVDFCGNYIMNALGSIYQYVKDFWQQILDDSANVLAQIVMQASATLRTIVRLVKILYTYAKQLGDLVLCEKVEAIIVWTALAIFAVAKWFYHLNKFYQNACDAAIRIIVETWNEPSVEVRPRSSEVAHASSSGGVKTSASHTAATAHGSSAAGETRHHEASVAGGSVHEDEAARQRKARE